MIQDLSVDAILGVVPDYEQGEALVGVALSRVYTNDIRVMAHNQFWEDPENPDERSEWLSDGDCFIRQECDRVAFRREADTKFPLGIEVTTTFQSEGRCSASEYGPAFLQRRLEPLVTRSSKSTSKTGSPTRWIRHLMHSSKLSPKLLDVRN